LFGACGVMYVEHWPICGELRSRLVSDDIVGAVNASVKTIHRVLTTLKTRVARTC